MGTLLFAVGSTAFSMLLSWAGSFVILEDDCSGDQDHSAATCRLQEADDSILLAERAL